VTDTSAEFDTGTFDYCRFDTLVDLSGSPKSAQFSMGQFDKCRFDIVVKDKNSPRPNSDGYTQSRLRTR
jgi:hypothetical protein